MVEGIRRNWRVSEERREERNQRVTSFPKNGICFINHDNETAIHKGRGYKVGDENKEREERGGVKKKTEASVNSGWNVCYPLITCFRIRALSDDKIKVEHRIDRHDPVSTIDTR